MKKDILHTHMHIYIHIWVCDIYILCVHIYTHTQEMKRSFGK